MSDSSEILLQGSLTIETSKDIYEQIRKALLENDSVQVKFGNIDKIDVTFLQNICVNHKIAQENDKKLLINGTLPKKINDFIIFSGYKTSLESCNSNECFFKEVLTNE